MKIAIPNYAVFVLERLHQAGFEGYCVGGCVRDTLLARDPGDWDVTTNALPQQVMEVFANERVLETGLAHGTVTILVMGQPVEVTTYRIDGEYSDGRHPDDVTFTRSLREDLARRDFTINALAYCPKEGVIDFFDGVRDLENGIIRCVGDPDRRFREDALRILRALRFSSVLGFAIEKSSADCLRHYRKTLAQVSAERISSEIVRIVCGQAADQVVTTFLEVLQEVFPGLSKVCCGLNQLPPDPALRLTWMLSTLSPHQAGTALSYLRYSTELQKSAGALRSHLNDSIPQNRAEMLDFLHRAGEKTTRGVLLLKKVRGESAENAQHLLEDILQAGDCWSLRMLAISGSDLIAAGFPQGPMLGQLLEQLLAQVISGQLPNERDALLLAVKSL